MAHTTRRLICDTALVLALLPGFTAASTIVPQQPIQFERVDLRRQVDSCAFNASSVEVRIAAGTIQVFDQPNACLLPGPPALVDIQLGAYPAGTYRVEIRDSLSPAATPVEQLDLVVQPIVHTLQFPATAYPLTNHSGHWWVPRLSGWGLSLHQGALHTLFGVLSVFGPDRAPTWFTLQSGTWSTPTRWSGKLVKTTGPISPNSQSAPVSTNVDNSIVGTASLDFGRLPGADGTAQFSYTLDGSTISTEIVRARIF
jgi:hypothetical protein